MYKYCALLSLCAGVGLSADFVTGQAARLVIGQSTFTSQTPGTSSTLLGGVGGLAYAADTLFAVDSNRASFIPLNNRVLIFPNVSQNLPSPTAEIPVSTLRCPVCVTGASVVLGQASFTTSDIAVTQTGMRTPTAVASDGKILVVADTSNNRVLIWKSIPANNGQPADLVLGQPNFTTVQTVVVDAKSFRAPQGVWIQNGKLYVADTQNNRVMVWNSIPTANNQPADFVLGQANFTTVPQVDLTKAGLNAQANTMLNPVSVTSDGVRLFVTDLGHNRVLIWNSIPTQTQQAADVEIGQKDFQSATPNDTPNLCPSNGTDSTGAATYPSVCGKTLNFPRFALGDGTRLFVADGGNDRVLIYNTIPTQNAAAPDEILGQPDENSSVVTSSTDLFHPLLNQSASDVTPTPTSLAWDGTNLYVTDPSNRRILVFTPAYSPSGPNVAINGVRNAASREIFALAQIAITGTIQADDSVTVTINSVAYTYKVVKDDTIETILTNLAGVINAGNGDPNLLAQAEPSLSVVKLVARVAGSAGNSITLSVTVSTNAKITATSTGPQGGENAAIIAPGTLVTLLGTNLADTTASADLSANGLPKQLAGVEVYIDGIRAPLLMVSPTQINAQIPFEVADGNSSSAYVRIQHADGSVTYTTAVGIPVSLENPGIFAQDGDEPRVALAYHGSSYATATVSVDGSITAGDVATITIDDRSYNYIVQNSDTLGTVRDGLIALIQSNPDERVTAAPANSFTRIALQAKVTGPEGDGILLKTSTSTNATVILSPSGSNLCCANVGGAPITPDNPAIPGETIIVYATGLGLVQPTAAALATTTGFQYLGPEQNDPNESVSSQAGGFTANVISAGLKRGAIGIYEVKLQLLTSVPQTPAAQVTISQNIYTSNVVTIPIGTPSGPAPAQ